MKLPGRVAMLGFCLFALDSVRGADATSPVDYKQRNEPFAPGATVTPGKQTPAVNQSVQGQRVEKVTIEKEPSSLGARRAPVDVQESREKQVRDKDSHRPEVIEQPTSAYNQKASSISTTDSRKPVLVAKYQDGLTAASASNMARFPALDQSTTAKINRFVFRKNPPEAPVANAATSVTPAGGAREVRK